MIPLNLVGRVILKCGAAIKVPCRVTEGAASRSRGRAPAENAAEPPTDDDPNA